MTVFRTKVIVKVLHHQYSPSENGQERPLWFLKGHGKVVQLLLHQKTSCLLREIHSNHGARVRQLDIRLQTQKKKKF